MKKQDTAFGIAMYRIFLMLVFDIIFFMPTISLYIYELFDKYKVANATSSYSFYILYIIWIVCNIRLRIINKIIKKLILIVPVSIYFLLSFGFINDNFYFAKYIFIGNLIFIILCVLQYKKTKMKF